MKKFLVLFLVLVMAFSCILISCKGTGDNGGSTTSDTEDPFIGLLPPAASTTTPTTPAPINPDDFTWTQGNGELVYVKAPALNVRSTTSNASDAVVDSVKFGESFTRIRYNSAWTEISYKGNNCYVATQFVTDKAGSVVFDKVDSKTVYVNVENTLNLRTSTLVKYGDGTIYSDNIGCVAKRGAELVQVGVSRDGTWAKVTFACGLESHNHDFLYCNTDFLSDAKPSDSTEAPSYNPTPIG